MTKSANVKCKLYSFDDIEFIEIVKLSISFSDVLRKLGLTTNGGSSTKSIKNRISDLKLDTTHFTQKGVQRKSSTKANPDLNLILVENSTYSRNSLKRRIIKEGYIKYECSICKINNWLGNKLVLHLDHVNGVNNDNRIENLRLLCPNCHSQTETYSGKNKGK